MKKLAAADASFLYAETNKCTSNIASVNMMILPEGVTSKRVYRETLSNTCPIDHTWLIT